MKALSRSATTLGLLLITYVLTWFIWIKGEQLALTLILLIAATLAAGFISSRKSQAEDLPLSPAGSPETGIQGFSFILGILAIGTAYLAYKAVLGQQWEEASLAIAGGALAWRLRRPEKLPDFSPKIWWLLAAAVLAVSAYFRLHLAGAIPNGFLMVDEPHIMVRAREYANGLRQTYAVGDNWTEGVIPLYLEAFGLKIFGDGMLGWRMESIVIGILITFLIYRIGRDIENPWMGLVAALFWAVSVWPVTITRAPYFMAETHFIVLICFFLLFWAFRNGSSLLFALGGFFWGLCFSTYVAGQLMAALVPWVVFLLWTLQPRYRANIRSGAVPMLAGFFIGIAPLLLWGFELYPSSVKQAYFSHLYLSHEAGDVSGTTLERFDRVLSRVFGQFPSLFSMLSSRGPVLPYYMPRAFPVIQPVALGLFLLGLSGCLARFRQGFYAFLIYWWFGGMLPGLVANPGTCPDDRRAMMMLPPLLLISGVGLLMASQTITQAISKKHQAWTMLGVVAIFFCCFGAREWDNYFLRNQSEFDLLTWNRSNAGSYHRAVYEQDHLAPVFLLTSRRSYTDSWAQPAEDPFRFEEVGVLDPGMTTLPIQLWPNYYQSDGLFGALRSALSPVLDKDGKPLPPKDVLVALTPFYFYLEPLLHDMGGKTVAEVPLARSSEGLVRDDVSMAVDDNLSLKLVRIAGLSPSTIDAMQKSRLFSIQVEELNPPGMTRDTLKNLDVSSKDYRKLADDYVLHPYWKVGKRASMPLPDPWIWDINGQVDSILPPCRLKLTFDLDVPQDGNYAFGASSTHMAKVSVDGKTAFFRDPDDPKSQIPPPANSKWIYGQGIDSWLGNAGFLANEAERRGLVGKAVFLKAGKHQLSVEQIWLSSNPAWNEVLRAVWQKPGGAIETLPLESMHPLPSGQLAGP